ncbi:HPP family protein [Haloarcula onubensis]|uniref:HPP family protein n=1 Tax=Haloarcula onubensis TaxID=2950539 RepID=A0ABU2FPK2_9EURY|nr:HPP family protein [Halomicroarcula sp. S3CR25-11]MDS0282693.1 HPP family protein [Halomicroarcula sp. S3CR25-11]
MFESLRDRVGYLQRQLRRQKRRRVRALRRWLEDTQNLLHLSVLVIVPLLIGAVTWLANTSPVVSFLVYPPLASGTYTLFADPGSRYAKPRRFVGGMTAGALSGWVALELTAQFWYAVPPTQFQVHAGAAALGIFLTGALTWLFEVEVPTAYSSALLVLVTGSEQLLYVAGITVASVVVAGAFLLWRRHFYRERARYLYQSTGGDDQILVPVRDEMPTSLACFAGRIAAAHDAGKVVLMDTVDPETIDEVEARLSADGRGAEAVSRLDAAEDRITERSLARLEQLQADIQSVVDVPCEFVVAVESDSTGQTVLQTADAENCDLVVAPYETRDGEATPFVSDLLTGAVDVVAFRSTNGCTDWREILVMVRSAGPIANAMLDFAQRLSPGGGAISLCTCIAGRPGRRRAEIMLETLAEPFGGSVETRVTHESVGGFLDRNAANYDLAVVGASSDRHAASRVLSPPTHECVRDIDCDLAIVHRP